MAAMPPTPGTAYKVGLVGTGIHLVHAIEALRGIPGVTIAIVADASDRSEGGKLAKTLHLPVVKNAMEVFKTEANLVLEVSGDERQYERLLSIKPPSVEVMSVRGARLLIDLLKKAEGATGGGEAATPRVATDGIHLLEPLAAALEGSLRHTGAPGDAAKTLLPGIAHATGMEWAALAMPGASGALSWIVAAPESMALSRLPAEKVKQVLGRGEALWLARPSKGVGTAGILPLRAGEAVLGLLLVGRSGDSAATPDEILACQLAAGSRRLLPAGLGHHRGPAGGGREGGRPGGPGPGRGDPGGRGHPGGAGRPRGGPRSPGGGGSGRCRSTGRSCGRSSRKSRSR